MAPFKHIDAAALSTHFDFDYGFHHPDWDAVREWIEKNIPENNWVAAQSEFVDLWLSRLRDDLGGSYRIAESPQTVLLSDQTPQVVQDVLEHCRNTVQQVKQVLGETAWRGREGRDVILLFSESDDYYSYISRYSMDGEQAGSGGVAVSCEHNTHVAVNCIEPMQVAYTIVHELSHDALAHLPLPVWLNEAVAQRVERFVAAKRAGVFDAPAPVMWAELAERHFSFWDERNIQSFWAGRSFFQPGDASELSYSLAEVLLQLLGERCDRGKFRAFIEKARQEDGGAAAAAEFLGLNLGDLAATFLGEGDWAPNPESMASFWRESAQ